MASEKAASELADTRSPRARRATMRRTPGVVVHGPKPPRPFRPALQVVERVDGLELLERGSDEERTGQPHSS
jgi:hypothetical protein